MNSLFIRVFKEDKWIHGLIVGLFIPVVLFAGLIYLFESLGLMTMDQGDQTIHILRPRTLSLIALCINALVMQVFKSLRWDQSMRGLAVATFICVILWLLKYSKEIF
ncbi:MAG: hypothetical protein ABI761_16030 [Saprospiraceae bacterium]